MLVTLDILVYIKVLLNRVILGNYFMLTFLCGKFRFLLYFLYLFSYISTITLIWSLKRHLIIFAIYTNWMSLIWHCFKSKLSWLFLCLKITRTKSNQCIFCPHPRNFRQLRLKMWLKAHKNNENSHRTRLSLCVS